jgi:hypothetical protein
LRTQLLSDLNHGVPPTTKELQFVMHTADGKVRICALALVFFIKTPDAMRCTYADAVWARVLMSRTAL